ncbi:complement C1q tumor necrosis factor-related protein 1 [Megalops cyprinoides]|uniref:complement C1q tumor necrosis factor-related protein 1 n=1 Tax=Megalops cyprinoides TaxID=118141 RepID=UPI0018653437|nr:complement C1q tumor necrosis factor-related protein 1 [Megalops cyprinoides]
MMQTHKLPGPALCLAVLVLLCMGTVCEPYRTPFSDRDPERSDPRADHHPSDYTGDYSQEYHRETSGAKRSECHRCCDPEEEPPRYPYPSPQYQVVPHINITILKGEKGDHGQRGPYGKSGKTGQTGPRGPHGLKGSKGNIGVPGDPCKTYYSAFSVGRKKALHSNDYYQTLIFDTVFVNLYNHFNMFSGKFYCYVPGIYFFSLNVHTWNQKETYLHIMRNEQEMAILYAQPSDRSIMQSQSFMLDLEQNDEVWVRLFKGERENAVFSDDFDTYITFSGYLIKAKSEG